MAEAKRTCTVYGLASSEDGKIRYVGQTVCGMVERVRLHHVYARKMDDSRVYRWIRRVIASGHKILSWPIESDAVWDVSEIRLIAFYRKHGADLTNSRSGGSGTPGVSEETRRKISASLKGRVQPPHVIASHVAALIGTHMSPESNAKRRAKMLGRKWADTSKYRQPGWVSPRKGVKYSLAERIAIGERQKGKTIPESTRALLRARSEEFFRFPTVVWRQKIIALEYHNRKTISAQWMGMIS